MPLIKCVDGVDVEMTPEEGAEFLASLPGPIKGVPHAISDRQFYQQLAVVGTITQAEALAAVRTGVIPAALQAFVDVLPGAEDKFNAEMLLSGAVSFERNHPLTNAIAAAQGLSSNDVDDFFIAASKL